MSDDDLNDFVTINVTCDQASALAKLFVATETLGLWSVVLDDYDRLKLKQFAETMTLEIKVQKTGMEE